jgi:hypothetical protein
VVDFHQIQYGGYAVEDDFEAINFNSISLLVPKWQKFKLQRCMQSLRHSTWDHVLLCSDSLLKGEQLLIKLFFEKQKNMNIEGS